MIHCELLEKQEQKEPKTSRRREIIKKSAEIYERQIKLSKESMKHKVFFLKKLTRLTSPGQI
jgi:hypothetical protein